MVESRYFTRPAAQPSTSVYEEETRLRKSLVPTTSYVVVEFLPTSTVVFSERGDCWRGGALTIGSMQLTSEI
jgi:hypothetical protein